MEQSRSPSSIRDRLHWSATDLPPRSTIDNRQRALLQDLRKHGPPKQPFHVPVWINKEKALGRGIHAAHAVLPVRPRWGAVVARIFDLWRIRFYENGVVSINLPISPQVVGGRATRTTHPQVLNGFSEIFSAIFQKPFAVENPFCWMTKAEGREVDSRRWVRRPYQAHRELHPRIRNDHIEASLRHLLAMY